MHATYGEDRYLYPQIVLLDRPPAPELVIGVVAEPGGEAALTRLLQPPGPGLAPGVGVVAGVGRSGVPAEHRRGPGQHPVAQDAAVLPVNVIIEPVVCGVEGDHRGEGGGLVEGHLETIESAPALAVHPNLAIAPGLGGDPSWANSKFDDE